MSWSAWSRSPCKSSGKRRRGSRARWSPPLAIASLMGRPGAERGVPAERARMTINFTDQSISVSPITNWNWTFEPGATSTLQNPVYVYNSVGAFPVQLIIMNQYGCLDTVVNYAIVDPVYLYYAPNAFTPDGDGLNDVFMVKGDNIDPDNFEMDIFDRWGEKIFKTTDLNVGWNGCKHNVGALVQQDVYVYKVNLKDWSGKKHQYIGHVTLVK